MTIGGDGASITGPPVPRRRAAATADPLRRRGPARGQLLLALAIIVTASRAAGAAEIPQDFQAFLSAVRTEAQERGVGAATLDAALRGVRPVDRVLELQSRQPESTLSWAEYRRRIVSEDRVVRGRRLLAEHAALLDEIAARYGVQPRFLVALWGIESDYGGHTGDTPAVAALATLAWKGRRGDYFRRELLELLVALEKGYATPEQLRSSWAGALGQCQFMPSNFRRFAVDHDGDGRRDIWGSTADVLASMANFLKHLGWKDDETWGRPVLLPTGFDARLAGDDAKLRLSKWQELGVRRINGDALPAVDLWAVLLLPDGPRGNAFLVYDDFFALLRWNRSHPFALAVGELSNRLR